MKRIAIDMDEVMADFSGGLLDAFNARYGTDLTKEDTKGTTLFEMCPEQQLEIYNMINTPEFFRALPVIEGSRETIMALHEHYEIIIATAAMEAPNSFTAKYDWLKEYFDFLDDQYFVFCGNKSTVNADYLIDDNMHQLQKFNDTGILFSASHNINVDHDLRMDDWKAVEEFFLQQTAE